MNHISPEELRKLLRYDAETGALTWLPRPATMFRTARDCRAWNTRYSNKPAMTSDNGIGYRVGKIGRRLYCAHRVAWTIIHGRWPDGQIDHMNGIRSDNRLTNLREVTASENAKNTSMRAANKSGHTGVFWDRRKGKWSASMRSNGKSYFLGYFTEIEDAVAARSLAESGHGFHQNHGRRT